MGMHIVLRRLEHDYLAHALCEAGNEVTILAAGSAQSLLTGMVL